MSATWPNPGYFDQERTTQIMAERGGNMMSPRIRLTSLLTRDVTQSPSSGKVVG